MSAPKARERERSREPAPAGAIVAVLERRGRFLTAEPLFPQQSRADGPSRRNDAARIVLKSPRADRGRKREARLGDLVLIQAGSRSKAARIVRVLGRPEVARDVIEALLLDRGLRRGFDAAVEHEARAAADRVRGAQGSRRDLRRLATFTIDPVGARDFDDAISASVQDDGSWRVWVHIADVSAFVSPRDGYRIDGLVKHLRWRCDGRLWIGRDRFPTPGLVRFTTSGIQSHRCSSIDPPIWRSSTPPKIIFASVGNLLSGRGSFIATSPHK